MFDNWTVMNYKLERIRRETGVSQLKYVLLHRHLPGGTAECTNILGIVGVAS
jgi:hypothetical protein